MIRKFSFCLKDGYSLTHITNKNVPQFLSNPYSPVTFTNQRVYSNLDKIQPANYKQKIKYQFSYMKQNFQFCKMTTKETIEFVQEKIFQILKDSPKCDVQKLDQLSKFQDLGFDSLDQVELIVAFEENLGVNLENDEALKIETVQNAINIFSDKLVNKS